MLSPAKLQRSTTSASPADLSSAMTSKLHQALQSNARRVIDAATTGAMSTKTHDTAYEVDISAEYRVTSRPEIIAALRALLRDNILVTLHFGGKHDLLLTRLLAIRAEEDELIIDAASQDYVNQALIHAERASAEAQHNRIKLFFDARGIALTLHEGKPALRLALPMTLLRLQRRGNFRVRTPVLTPSSLLILLAGDAKATEFRVSDISCGGLAFVADSLADDLQTGMIYPRCRLNIPQVGEHVVNIEIRHTVDYTDGMGRRMRRVGVRFLGLSGQTAPLIARYVNQIDVQRRDAERHS
jgi:flagellar brake protein